MTTIAPVCAGRCGRQMDSPPHQDPWLAVLAARGPFPMDMPRATYFVCPQCETEVIPTLLANFREHPRHGVRTYPRRDLNHRAGQRCTRLGANPRPGREHRHRLTGPEQKDRAVP